MKRASIAVIGGGWAGFTAAVELAEAGHAVTVFEAARALGGRARVVAAGSHSLDNGQHILLGAYVETLRQMEKVGVDTRQAFLHLPLQMRYPPADDGMDFVAPRLPAPLHLLAALLRAKGLAREDKLALARFTTSARWMDWQLHEDCSVITLLERFDQTERLYRLMWRPLCIAALNTPPEQASAQVFLNVLRDSLGAKRSASDMLVPRRDLSSLFPVPAADYVQQRGGTVLNGTAVRSIARTEQGWALSTAAQPDQTFDGIVVATSASAARTLLADTLMDGVPDMQHEPIATCYLQYAPGTRLAHAMHALLDDPAQDRWGQFAFDRGQLDAEQDGLLAVVVSTASAAGEHDQDELAKAIAAQLATSFAMPVLAAPLWTQVITEKRATFSCTPGLQRIEEATACAGLVLAGDYLAGPYPATIESAVRSGRRAASLLIDHFSE